MIRLEQPGDVEAVRRIIVDAFRAEAEADLVELLRASGNLTTSLMAFDDALPVGYIAFSPVTIDGCCLSGAGLAPVAVLSDHQKMGFGSRLIREGLKQCRECGVDYVVVLGFPEYYQRFGFRTASRQGLRNEYGVDEEFMVVELSPDCLSGVSGVVRYGDEFRVFE